jgi:PilZ domain-containing protein
MTIVPGTRTAERFHPRVEANLMVKVILPGRTVVTKARDLSMAGLFLHAQPADSLRELTLSIPLPGDRELVATCAIRRRDMNGVALEFGTLDWDDFLALARFLHPRLP